MSDSEINTKSDSPVKCHLMPFKIDYEGPAAVSNFFETSIIESKNSDTLQASFRGRPFKGQQVNIPQGYFGAVLQRKGNNQVESVGEFKDLYYWKYDEEPSQSDPLPSSLNWFLISSALHECSDQNKSDH